MQLSLSSILNNRDLAIKLAFSRLLLWTFIILRRKEICIYYHKAQPSYNSDHVKGVMNGCVLRMATTYDRQKMLLDQILGKVWKNARWLIFFI